MPSPLIDGKPTTFTGGQAAKSMIVATAMAVPLVCWAVAFLWSWYDWAGVQAFLQTASQADVRQFLGYVLAGSVAFGIVVGPLHLMLSQRGAARAGHSVSGSSTSEGKRPMSRSSFNHTAAAD